MAAAALPGFDAPAAGFEAPLEMLAACHGRVERQCQTLSRLVPHLAANGPDQSAQAAAHNVMRYFDTSARHHHADEEDDLFPALLRAAPQAEFAHISELISALRAQHRELEQAWSTLRRELEGIGQGTIRTLDGDQVAAFVDLYRRHIDREEAELLPDAARIVGLAGLDTIGRAMRLRRGINEV